MSDVSKMMKSSLIYFVGNVLSKLVIFFMLPLYTKYIVAADFGYYDSILAIINFLTSVLFLDIGSGIMRFVFEKKHPNYDVMTTGMTIFLISSVLYLATSVIFGLLMGIQYPGLVIMYGLLSAVSTAYTYLIRGLGESTYYSISGVISAVVNVGTNLLLILVFKQNYSALYVASICGFLVQIIMLECKVKFFRNIKKSKFQKTLFKSLLRFSLPLCLNSVGYWFMTSANRVIITVMLGSEANGYFAVADKFTQLLFLVSTCVQLAWQELVFAKGDDEKQKLGEFYTKASSLYIKVLTCAIICALPAISIVFPLFVNSAYESSKVLIPIAILGTAVSIYSSFLGSIFGAIKRTGHIFKTTVLGAVINLIAIFICINSNLGVISANIAFFLGFLACTGMRVILLKNYLPFKLSITQILLLAILFIVISLTFTLNILINIIMLIVAFGVSLLILRQEIILVINRIKGKRKNE